MDAPQRRGFACFVGEGLWSVGARRRRVANLREGPLRLDLLLERVLLQAAGFARVVDFGETSQQFPPRRSEETGPQ
ncbi:hypothetical protein Taro_017509 [Colocasia esculenta]|uniref:Uncharacterized protein n=1 Tax=Colocasia esculenta TaxID=4460 RepID=A0A843UTF1_COLES|nr:hypothetical protein [Colocasia esculenta]